MKILNTGNLQSELFNNKGYSLPGSTRKKSSADEFREILEQTMNETMDDPDEFRILLPKHGHFWDNGYEDLE